MKYAHIYQAAGKNKQFELILTTGHSISCGVLSKQVYDSKALAKKAAKEAGAKPWNY